MPITCVAVGCLNRGKVPGVTYHNIPKDGEVRQKWIDAIKRANWVPKHHSKLCSAHFTEADMDRTSLCVVRIREGAVPSIFPKMKGRPGGNGRLSKRSADEVHINNAPAATIESVFIKCEPEEYVEDTKSSFADFDQSPSEDPLSLSQEPEPCYPLNEHMASEEAGNMRAERVFTRLEGLPLSCTLPLATMEILREQLRTDGSETVDETANLEILQEQLRAEGASDSGYETTNLETLREEMKTEGNHVCPECGYRFNQPGELRRHMRVHTGLKPFKCPDCDYSSAQSTNLKRHRLSNHSGAPYKCDQCPCSFTRADRLKAHRFTHTGVRRYECVVCSRTFGNSNNLKSHLLLHAGERPFKCHLCEFSCAQKGNLKMHLDSHEGVKRKRTRQKCNICGAVTYKMKLHMATHSEYRPFKCDRCKYAGKQKQGLVEHVVRRHGGVKPLKCAHCEYRAMTRKELGRHESSKKHKNVS